MKWSFGILFILALVCLIPAVCSADGVAPLGGANQSYITHLGNDQLEHFVNVPYTMEDVGYPIELFLGLFFSGIAFILFGLWLTSRPDYIAHYTLIGAGVIICGIFAVLAYMAPLVCTHQLITQVVPTAGAGGSITLNATNAIYMVQSVTFVFSSWVSYAMGGGVAIGILFTVAGVLTMFRTNKEKSIEPALDQDGNPISYRNIGKKY